MDAVGIIQRRRIRFRPFVFFGSFVTNKIMNATEEATPFKVVNDRWQGFGTDMEIGQTIEGNFSPGIATKYLMISSAMIVVFPTPLPPMNILCALLESWMAT